MKYDKLVYKNVDEAIERINEMLNSTEHYLGELVEDTPKDVTIFQKQLFKNYKAINTLLKEYKKEKRKNEDIIFIINQKIEDLGYNNSLGFEESPEETFIIGVLNEIEEEIENL